MSEVREPSLAGVLRVVYSLATALAVVFVVVMAITAFYDPPQPDFSSFDGSFGFSPSVASADYNRDVSMIMMVVSAPLFIIALSLASDYNPFRVALVLGGGTLLAVGVGYAGDGSDQWIGFVFALVNLMVLVGGLYFLDGGPLLRRSQGALHPAFADANPDGDPPSNSRPSMQE